MLLVKREQTGTIVDCVLVVSREQALFFLFLSSAFTSVILWAAYRVNRSPCVGGGEECISSLTLRGSTARLGMRLDPQHNSRNYTSEKNFLKKKTFRLLLTHCY